MTDHLFIPPEATATPAQRALWKAYAEQRLFEAGFKYLIWKPYLPFGLFKRWGRWVLP